MENRPIRIAQIMGKMNSGGVESVVMNYYRYIDKDKIQFDFIVDENSTHIPYKEIESMGGQVILVPTYQKIGLYIKELKRIFKEKKYRIVHSHLNSLSIFPLYVAKKTNIPVRIAHSHSTSNKKEWKKNIIKNILRPLSKINASHYFCCSELAGRWLFGNKTYDRGKVTLINNAIEIDNFIYDETIQYKIRKELNLSDKLVIGHVGRFVNQKNHTYLIDIFYEIHKKNKNAVLLLIGEGPLLNEIKLKVEKLELNQAVKFLGVRNDVNILMQAMDVFILPSLYEGLPVVGVEAQAAGNLCILSEDMTKDTKILKTTKFLSLSESPEYWAEEILKAQKSFTKKNTKKEIIQACFDIKTESKKLERLYINLNCSKERENNI